MEPRNYTINDLFDGNKVYVVPRYQRLYVWNKEDQWAPLWEDVTEIARNLFDHAENQGSNEINPTATESHFFGTLVLKTSGYTPDLGNKWRVIDGQQRLTTLQLMMSAVANELRDRGLTEQAAPVTRLTSNYPQANSFSEEHIKITHGSEHYDGFIEAMNPLAEKNDIAGSMGDGYRYFRESASEWFKVQNGPMEKLAVALTTSIITKLRVVAIYLDPHEEEHKIFETLNARGEPLTEWDKIKNFMLYKADKLYKADEQPHVNQDDFFERYLDSFDQDWWREEVGRGVARRPRSDVFADYWLESKTTKPVGARRIFRDFQSYVNRRSDSLVNIGEELIRDAEHFKKYERRYVPENSVERRFHNRRLWIGIGAWWPMIFELNRVFEKFGCDDDVRAECFSYLESFLVRRLVVGHQARSYDQVGFEILRSIQEEMDDPNKLGDVIRRRFMRYTQPSNRWPDDSDVRRAVMTRNMPWYAQRLVLEAIEVSLIPQNAGYQVLSGGLEVEHLMPEGWRSGDWLIQRALMPRGLADRCQR